MAGQRPDYEVFVGHKNPDGSFAKPEKVGAMWPFKSGKEGWSLKLGDQFYLVFKTKEQTAGGGYHNTKGGSGYNKSGSYQKPQQQGLPMQAPANHIPPVANNDDDVPF